MPAADQLNDPVTPSDLGGDGRVRRRGYGLWPKQWRWRISLIVLALIGFVAGAAWLGREQLAADFIDETLAANGVEASYEIVSIGTSRQVIANLVVGDPEAPDFTADEAVLELSYALGAPTVGGVELVRPRLYGRLVDGAVSFGSLDPFVYTEGEGSAGLPFLDLTIVDGRALIESEYGAIGVKLEGAGRLDDGFEGMLAATMPGLALPDCSVDTLTIFGKLTTKDDRARFAGPVRLRGADCQGARLARADIAADITLSDDITGIDGALGIEGGALSYGGAEIYQLGGSADVLWRFAGEGDRALDISHALIATGLRNEYGAFAQSKAEGTFRLSDDLTRYEWRADITGSDMALAPASLRSIHGAKEAGAGTFLGPLLARFEGALTGALVSGELRGDVTVRGDPEGLRVIIPEARLRSGAEETVLALSRVSYSRKAADGTERLTGNIMTGGRDMPLINGRMEGDDMGELGLRLTMAEYRVGEDALAIPRMTIRQRPSGGVGFAGMVEASGALPGGSFSALTLPVEGQWSPRSGLAIGRRCVKVGFDALAYYQFSLQGRELAVCPGESGAIVRFDDALMVEAVSEDLALAGRLGSSPTRLAAARATFRYPGLFEIDDVAATIGPDDNAVRLSAMKLDGTIAETVGGGFSQGSAALDIVPLDIGELSGEWSYADGALTVGEGSFILSDRPDPVETPDPRFKPLYSSGANLVLKDNVILALADLRNPKSGDLVSAIIVQHDINTAIGNAQIAVPGVTFGDRLQPEDLSILTKGVIAEAEGTVSGRGTVTWEGDTVESEGTFGSEDFDFAAAFGPVRGIRGQVTFTDLLAMTTAPAQVIEVASVNSGIEALGGRLVYSIEGGQLITIEDGRWPFMGGELILNPVTLDYGGGGGQSYVFEIVGLDAATFVTQMELDNLGATGTFDGTIPIIFDANGNGAIRGGLLIARPPGGNVSYVGELTYEDMGEMANYAFQSLRSLDYRQMSVELNGSLAGEIVTNFQIDGVRQGEGAARNFVTRRLAELPIRFKINVRSENFYMLTTIVRGLFDPTVFDTQRAREEFNIGDLLRSDGLMTPLVPFVGEGGEGDPGTPPDDSTPPEREAPKREAPEQEAKRRDESTVQPPESDEMP